MHRIVLIVSLFALLAGCTFNPATNRTQFLLLSTDEEIALGTEAMPTLVDEYGGEIESPQLRAFLTRVGTALLAGIEEQYRDLPWEFTLLDSDVINAFALPGGKVFMSRGLMQHFTHEAEVAGVLGHEIGHVTGQHVDERISKALLLELGIGALGSTTDSVYITEGAKLFSNGYQLSFGRDQESEADVLGVRYMTTAGYDPAGMLDVLHVLQQAAGASRQPEFLSTHPHPETRIGTVSELLAGPYAYTQGNPDFGKFEERYEREAGRLLPPPPEATARLGGLVESAWCATCSTSRPGRIKPMAHEGRSSR